MHNLILGRDRWEIVARRTFVSLLVIVLSYAAYGNLPAVAQVSSDEVGSRQPAFTNYQVLTKDESLKRPASQVMRSLRRGFAAGDAELFDTVFDNYILPQWTQPEELNEISDTRQKLNGQFKSIKDAATRQHVNRYMLDKLSKMASGNFHPAVRYNCMLLLGELDLSPPASFSDPATPLPDALPLLLQALTDQNQIDAVKIAALVGIKRHSWSLRDNQQVTDAMLQLAKNKRLAPSAAVQTWMRCMAIDTLGNLKSAGAQNTTANSLSAIVDDAGSPLSVRTAAARALGKLSYENAAGLNPGAIVRQLGRLAMDSCKTEIASCKKEDRAISPRILRTQLMASRMGLMGSDDPRNEQPSGGIMPLLETPEEKQKATAIQSKIDSWLDLLDNEKLIRKLAPQQTSGTGMMDPMMGGGMMDPMMGGMGPGMPSGGRQGTPEPQDEMKIASDAIIKQIEEDLKNFATLLQ